MAVKCFIILSLVSQTIACELSGKIGSLSYKCSVTGDDFKVTPTCCSMAMAYASCDRYADKAACFKAAEAGKTYKQLMTECPVMKTLGEDHSQMAKYCTITMGSAPAANPGPSPTSRATCGFAWTGWSCSIPKVKNVCCQLVNAWVKCGGKTGSCYNGGVMDIVDKVGSANLREAHFDITEYANKPYIKKYCDVLADAIQPQKVGQFCKATKLFSVTDGKPIEAVSHMFESTDGETIEAPSHMNVVFCAFGGLALVVSIAAAVKRRWQPTSSETHDALEEELEQTEAERGLID